MNKIALGIIYISNLALLVGIILIIVASISPTLHNSIGLVSIIPSTTLQSLQPAQAVDGPSVFLGFLGSCQKANDAATELCTQPSFSPQYAFGVLPVTRGDNLIHPPPEGLVQAIIADVIILFIYFFLFTYANLRDVVPGGGVITSSLALYATAILGALSIGGSLLLYFLTFFWARDLVTDFNSVLRDQGPDLVATIGVGLQLLEAGNILITTSLIFAASRLHVPSPPGPPPGGAGAGPPGAGPPGGGPPAGPPPGPPAAGPGAPAGTALHAAIGALLNGELGFWGAISMMAAVFHIA